MDLPAEHVLDHSRHPRCKVRLDSPSVTHTEHNWSCGDALTIELRIENNRIAEIGWSGEGCAVSQAAMSLLAETLPGTEIDAAEQLKPQAIFDLLRIPVGARRMKCALLCLHTLRNAIRAARNDPPLPWNETVGNPQETS
jgi:nitrogen fixation protein NifU and related proteins